VDESAAVLYGIVAKIRSWDSSVGIATCYGLDGPGIKSQWGVRLSVQVQTGSEAHPVCYTVDTRPFLGVK